MTDAGLDPRRALLGAVCFFWALSVSLPGQVVITEIMAAKGSTFEDDDGNVSDWVELFNAGPASVRLEGHYLTDDVAAQPTRWRFPAVEIAPREHLVVFCSGKSRAHPGRALHTSFRLGGGDAVALVAPDGKTVLASFDVGKRASGCSRGLAQPFSATNLIEPGAPARWHVPTKASPGAEWRTAAFDDASWMTGQFPFGFDVSSAGTLRPRIQTALDQALRGRAASLYVRAAFDVADPASVDAMVLRVEARDGFVAWLNGFEVARRCVTNEPGWDAKASDPANELEAAPVTTVPVRGLRRALLKGKNVLALQVVLRHKHVAECIVAPELRALRSEPPEVGAASDWLVPSPGLPNGARSVADARRPSIEPKSRAFAGSLRVEITPSKPKGADDGAAPPIRYTLDGSEPGPASSLYEGPFEIQATTLVKARFSTEGADPGPVAEAGFVALDPALTDFTSNLPLIAVTPFAKSADKVGVFSQVLAVDVAPSGRSTFRGDPVFSGAGSFKTRGSSTLRMPKKGYGLDLQNDAGEAADVAWFGLPKESDWILYGSYYFDHTHVRNPLSLELSNRMGLWAPRARFVEVFVNSGADRLGPEDYVGLYVLIEKIKRGPHRVNVEKLDPTDNAEPEIAGGYILKVDRPGVGDVGFIGGRQQLQFVYPKEREISDPQRRWIKQFVDAFGDALNGPEFTDPEKGYRKFIDVDNFIDYHILNEYAANPDAYTLSEYMHLHRGGKLRMGPLWDMDRAMRTNADPTWVGKACDPREWTRDCYFNWWGVLFRDPAFRARYRERGRAHLDGALKLSEVHAIVDRLAAQVREAVERDAARWPILPADAWANDVAALKAWLAEKDAWFRSELLEAPELVTDTGATIPPLQLSIRHANASGEIYYTRDGADPKAADGSISPRAARYADPVDVAGDARIRARVKVGDTWSRLIEATFVARVPTLAITEVMFNPSGGHDYEFVEIANVGSEPVRLHGIRLAGAVAFSFAVGGVDVLAPGAFVVVVNDRVAFADRYDVAAIPIAGEYQGRMNNTSGVLSLVGPVGELVAEARYEDWFKEADGKGHSLVPADQVKRPERLLERAHWRVSREVQGSPGKAER